MQPSSSNASSSGGAVAPLMKDEYPDLQCAICGARADGLHYGAVSCRSCNAFFRRTVVEKAVYRCKHDEQCIIDADGRCSCRFCRYKKCLDSGMKIASVQPRRDPTGSQRERRKRSLPMLSGISIPNALSSMPSSFSSSLLVAPEHANTLLGALQSVSGIGIQLSLPNSSPTDATKCPAPEVSNEMPRLPTMQPLPTLVKLEEDEEDDEVPSRSSTSREMSEKPMMSLLGSNTAGRLDADEYQEFMNLVFAYNEHTRMMQLNFSSIDGFLKEMDEGEQLRAMEPKDVDKLSTVELTGLLYWIEKLTPFKTIPMPDRENLLKRYSVRKLSLDHFYCAAKHADEANDGNFVMNNYTYVPPDRTGFELPGDDAKQILAKKQTFAGTFDRFWKNVVRVFIDMRIRDAEIVYLHLLLLWSPTNKEHVSPKTDEIMKERRDWAMNRLFEWYHMHRFEDPGCRFGEVTMLLGEIETICDMHCQDFQVAKLFEFCDMSDYWYEELCYTPCNTNKMQYDPHIIENLKKFTAINFIERNNIKHIVVPRNEPQQAVNTLRPSMEVTVAAGMDDTSMRAKMNQTMLATPRKYVSEGDSSPSTQLCLPVHPVMMPMVFPGTGDDLSLGLPAGFASVLPPAISAVKSSGLGTCSVSSADMIGPCSSNSVFADQTPSPEGSIRSQCTIGIQSPPSIEIKSNGLCPSMGSTAFRPYSSPHTPQASSHPS